MKKRLVDIVNILFLIFIFIFIYIILTRNTYIFGALKDWDKQHWVIPEYFRNLFYQTHDLFPDFAFNLGGGQNIYNFSYYGLFSPVILFSYLLPFISMRTYIIVSSITLYLLSVIIMYFFIKKKSNTYISFMCSFLFMMATPLLFHLHRQIMFINYMPFLILGYVGVDRYFNSGKRDLLMISILMMILTSYFFSVGGIISIILYGVYVYLSRTNQFKFKDFIRAGIKFIFPIMISILSSCILILPTLYSLISSGRGESSSINFLSILIPKISASNLLYGSYTMGLTLISLFAIFSNLFSRKKENKFLSISIIIILTFPIIKYILNGGMYIEAKVLFPFIPLIILLVEEFFKNINTDFNYFYYLKVIIFIVSLGNLANDQYFIYAFIDACLLSLIFCLYKTYNKKKYMLLYLPFLVIMSIAFNFSEPLVRKDFVDDNDIFVKNLIDNDNDFYRINVYARNLNFVNNIYDIHHYSGYIYSSSSNSLYKEFYNSIGNEVPYRSYGMDSTSQNIFYNIYMGNKYIVANSKYSSYFYKKTDNKTYMYDNVYSLGYSSNLIMSEKDYYELNYPDSIYALTKYIIVDDDFKSNYNSPFEKIDLDYKIINSDIEINEDDHIKIEVDSYKKVRLKINNNLDNKTLLIRFKNNYINACSSVDAVKITINGIANSLSCSEWKYYNHNEYFNYIISKPINNLDISISTGKYDLSDFEFYTIDNDYISDLTDNKDMFNVDMSKTIGDKIVGKINSSNNGIFNLSIPYSDGFNIYVDNKRVNYFKTNLSFIGFDISKGNHYIEIEYKSPLKDYSLIISCIGIISMILICFII